MLDRLGTDSSTIAASAASGDWRISGVPFFDHLLTAFAKHSLTDLTVRARGDIVVTMDGDLQNSPSDLPKLVSAIDSGADVGACAGIERGAHATSLRTRRTGVVCGAPVTISGSSFASARISLTTSAKWSSRSRTSMGAVVTAPVGSTAVRAAIERHQPLLSLHGHIHESGGAVRLGRTLAVNAGSEYGEGVLRGVLVTVGGGKVLRYQATSG
jgi:cellulose synthase/poly-beta-1,6-N-acetylglucosamine synthase-like glycosyltransferase